MIKQGDRVKIKGYKTRAVVLMLIDTHPIHGPAAVVRLDGAALGWVVPIKDIEVLKNESV